MFVWLGITVIFEAVVITTHVLQDALALHGLHNEDKQQEPVIFIDDWSIRILISK